MAGTGGARPGAGRPRGPSKATLERLAIAERTVVDAKATGKKLAKEVLDEFMHLFGGIAAYYQPTPPDSPVQNANANEDKFKEYALLAVSTAADLAKYQSPTFKAIAVQMVPEQPPRPLLAPPPGGNVRPMLDDPEAVARVYKRMIAQVS